MSTPGFPKEFGKYMLTRKLATGGMAELFLAKTQGAEGFEREVVVKRILPSFSEDESFVKMFIDEASLTSKLQHPNIVQIFDFDVTDRQYYIAMEFIHGEDLTNILKDGAEKGMPLSVAQAVFIVCELAKGLHYAHTKEHRGKPLNIIHRDVTPHNAMISYHGDVKLMDFGIAKAAERSTKTQAGMVKGKVAYMSPEQARGKPLDPRSDLFALATVLWELLTHKRLFLRASDFETLTAILKEDAEKPSKHRKGIDQELDDIVLSALEKDREKRQPSVEVFCRELTRWYYKNADQDKENLGQYMRTLYAHKPGVSAPEPATLRAPTPEPVGELPRRAKERQSGKVEAPREDLSVKKTVEASVPDVLKALPPRRAQAQDLSSAATILEDGGLNQADLARALAASQHKKGAPDAAMHPVKHAAPAQSSKSGGGNTKMILFIVAAVLAGGGIALALAL
jgi:serine/threonine protein kinase